MLDMDNYNTNIHSLYINANDTAYSLRLRTRLAGAIGFFCTSALGSLLIFRAINFLRKHGEFYFPCTVPVLIQLCLFFICILDVPHFVLYVIDTDERAPLTYVTHIIAMYLVQCAFCAFALLWVEILNLGSRIKRIATIISRSLISISVVSALSFVIAFLSQAGEFDRIIQIFLAWWIAGTLGIMSTFFLFYGVYAQKRLNRMFWTGTHWQRQILRQVNQTVGFTTFFCYVRAIMLIWLTLEEYKITPPFFFFLMITTLLFGFFCLRYYHIMDFALFYFLGQVRKAKQVYQIKIIKLILMQIQ